MADIDPSAIDTLEEQLFDFISVLSEDHPLRSTSARQPVNAIDLQKYLVKARFPGGFIANKELAAVLSRCPPLGSDMSVNTVQWLREGIAPKKGAMVESSPSKAGSGGVGARARSG